MARIAAHSYASEPDARLASLARLGDAQAFEAIVDRYRPQLVAHAGSIVPGSQHDVVQQALISAWISLRRGCQVRDVRRWLLKITHRAALRARRQHGRAQALPAVLGDAEAQVDQVAQALRTRDALAAVADLPRPERDALMWTSVHGRSGREAAHALGVSEHALRQLVYRARTRVRAAARAFVPPLGLARLATRLSGRSSRASAALTRGAGTAAQSPSATAAAAKLTAAVAATAALGAPLLAVELAHHRRAAREAGTIEVSRAPRGGPRAGSARAPARARASRRPAVPSPRASGRLAAPGPGARGTHAGSDAEAVAVSVRPAPGRAAAAAARAATAGAPDPRATARGSGSRSYPGPTGAAGPASSAPGALAPAGAALESLVSPVATVATQATGQLLGTVSATAAPARSAAGAIQPAAGRVLEAAKATLGQGLAGVAAPQPGGTGAAPVTIRLP